MKTAYGVEDHNPYSRKDLLERSFDMAAQKRLDERDALRERDEIYESRAKWIRAFNRLEKAVTNHIDNCIDADDLAHVHKAVMRDLGPS